LKKGTEAFLCSKRQRCLKENNPSSTILLSPPTLCLFFDEKWSCVGFKGKSGEEGNMRVREWQKSEKEWDKHVLDEKELQKARKILLIFALLFVNSGKSST
jgi:hypothetical protein